MGSEKTRKRHVGNSNRKRYENSDPSRKRPSSKSNGDSRTHNDDGDSSPKLFTILFVIVAVLFVIVGVFGFLVFAEYLDLRTYLAFLRTNELKARSNSDKQNENSQPENKQNSEEPAKNSRPGSSTEQKQTSPTDDITNAADLKILLDIIKADTLLEKGKIEAALKKYDEILSKYPSSPRGTFGKANALNKQSEKLRSNPILEQCIAYYQKVVDLPDVPKPLLLKAADIAVERMNFRGWNGEAVRLRAKLAKMFPGDLSLMNNLGVSLLMIGSNRKAKLAFEEVLEKDPQNGFAQAHYGFILKTDDQNFPLAIRYLKSGLASKQPGTNKGLFYVHLGDALNRNGQKNESYDVFREGQKNGHFFSVYQRSLYNVDRLTGQPIWTRQQTGYQKYFKLLEDNWKLIRDEGLKNMDVKKGAFVSEEENLRETGDWKQFTLWAQGRRDSKNCNKVPKTCALIDQIPPAKGCTRGQVKFSVMQPGVHVWSHCGPTNCRLRAHLGLVVPKGPVIRVAEQNRTWTEGKFLIFDDSFEHEVWHEGDTFRLVLIVDFWHPELTEQERYSLSPI